MRVVLTFRGACFLVRIQGKTIAALAVIGGIAVDADVFTLMSKCTGVQTWSRQGLRDGAVKVAAWIRGSCSQHRADCVR